MIAILRQEPKALEFTQLLGSKQSKMSVANFVEAGVVTDSARDRIISRELDELAQIEIVPVSVEQGRLAREAYRDFGRGSGHAAKLNFGDCFAYALAKESGEALLYKGNDFVMTDVRPAKPGSDEKA